MVRSEVVLSAEILRLSFERYRCPVLATLGPGYGRPEQQRGYYGSARQTVKHIRG